ncbi:type II toxin-antitoxin system RelE/ParE family toxin [Nodosilinea sp. E11]|uniref:type II toxin-antitoxin system RelE/ParE family toxin n=1 Tax=Nodosilinea sp. E11 TaxID=3037479 RepID=UPI0029350B76|nr:type II toxin-antitoxin system RelE/ParE family toxin [Nodosilinea sp. E11]WOD40435.1 type II toxin-antitoxin system RelE/ParE family toxin [Nodosilinea sp. E11]
MSDAFSMRVEAAPTFRRNLRKLNKKYRSIQADVQPVIEKLEQGGCPGDRIPGLGYEVFKLRVRNRDIQKGKSGGYRLIYYLKTANSILLLTIYSKSEQDDITTEDIRQIIQEDL